MGTLKKELQLAKDIEELNLKYRNVGKTENPVEVNSDLGNRDQTEGSSETDSNLESSIAGESGEQGSDKGSVRRIRVSPVVLLTVFGLLILLAAGLALANALNSNPQPSVVTTSSGQQIFRTRDGKMQIIAPEAWTLNTTTDADNFQLVIQEKRSGKVILINKADLKEQGMTADDARNNVIEQTKSSKGASDFGEVISCKIGEYDAYSIDFTLVDSADDCRYTLYFIEVKDQLYVISTFADRDLYSYYKEDLYKIVNTFSTVKK